MVVDQLKKANRLHYTNAINKEASVYFAIAVALLTLNFLNVAAWSLGYYINPITPVFLISVFFVFCLKKSDNAKIILIIFLLATYVILSSPVTAWDARSIWFFHAKRIFFDNSLYAQLDGYAGWSHNDYPVLIPALAASVARSVGYWNEVLPRLSVLLALFPIFLVYGWLIRKNLYFTIWVSGILLICRFFLVNGYMDAILALYCGAAVILLLAVFSNEDKHRALRQEYLLLFFVSLTLPFIKNEGLLASIIIGICLSFRYLSNPKLLIIPVSSLCLYYLLWKHEVITHHIHTDLFTRGLVERGISRLTNPAQIFEILERAATYSGIYLLAGLLVFVFDLKRKSVAHLTAIIFILLYCGGIIFVYTITPRNLIWHLTHSADRTFMVVNVCVYSYIIYGIYSRWGYTKRMNETISINYPTSADNHPRWGIDNPHSKLVEIMSHGREKYRQILREFLNHSGYAAISIKELSPLEPFLSTPWLPGLDSLSLYCLIGKYQPSVYMEIGSGSSTKFAKRSVMDHSLDTHIISIDPQPRAEIDKLCDEIIRSPVECVDLRKFDQLQADDILFVDNSHRSFMNSDVTVFFLDILPRLNKGVIVEIHDIFLPNDYPDKWAGRYYNEQYLLAAYLLAECPWLKIILPNAYISNNDVELRSIVDTIFPPGVSHGGGSFWLEIV